MIMWAHKTGAMISGIRTNFHFCEIKMAASRMAKLAESALSKSVAVSTKVGMKGIGKYVLY